ncbi:glycosyltransferase family 1 protein [Conexibacter sp. SYSU D00693]|uniref:glycosyltransferase family 4 protein n=1 Tax=Conexibacter sp. SYSU D00693 TaxID=2812560 RepID=UPI001F11F5D1|nr:glycosyltransferase family 1 protein [Conexibacter sp. SYSU D00693]
MTTVGLDLAYLAPGATGGMETYARALVPALAAARPQLRFVVFAGRELAGELRAAPWVDGLRVATLPVSSDTRVRRTVVEQALLPAYVRRAGVDLVHSLGNTAPLAPLGVPLVLTLHDLIWARMPETHSGLLARGLGVLVPPAVRRAARVIAPSEATKRDAVELLGTPPEKVAVVPQGPGLLGGVEPVSEVELRARLGLGDGPLVLCPAPKRAHKNVVRLAQAMAGLDATLVVPGYPAKGVDADLEVEGARVVRAGWVSDAELEGLYAASTLLAFPSLAEGFGLPVVEAMRRGLPVACADATSLPEVAGDAALLFDPLDVRSIRGAVQRLLDDAALRGTLAERGRAQAARFTWEATARGTLAVYDAVLGA